jgi:hypothetical protein
MFLLCLLVLSIGRGGLAIVFLGSVSGRCRRRTSLETPALLDIGIGIDLRSIGALDFILDAMVALVRCSIFGDIIDDIAGGCRMRSFELMSSSLFCFLFSSSWQGGDDDDEGEDNFVLSFVEE